LTSDPSNHEHRQNVESERFENPVRFEYREGMTTQKLSDPMFQFERTRIYWALVAALIGTVLCGPLAYGFLATGSLALGALHLVVMAWLWVRAGRRTLSLRGITAVFMAESKADRGNVWETHQATRVVRGDADG